MSTHRLILRRRRAFRLPAFSILAGLLLALQLWLPASAFAATRQSSPAPAEDVSRAGVSVVRLLVFYSVGKTTDKASSISVAECTGLGVLLSSQLMAGTNKYENWVLTDGSLVTSENQATCLDTSPAATLSHIDIYVSRAYSSKSLTPFSTATGPKVICRALPAKCSEGPALFSFQSDFPQPFIDFPLPSSTLTGSSALTPKALQLISSDKNVKSLNSSDQDAAHVDDYRKQLQVFLQPNTIEATSSRSLESGTPLVDNTGSLSGLFLSNASAMKVDDILRFVTVGMEKIQGASNPVHDNWKSGMDAYYITHSMTEAHTDFSKAFDANPQFEAAQQFATLSTQTVDLQARKANNVPANQNPSLLNGSLQVAGFTLPYWALAAAGVFLLFIIILLLVVFRGAARRRRKRILAAELADAERRATVAAQRIAEMEATQHNNGVPYANGVNSSSSAQEQPTLVPQQYSPSRQPPGGGQDPLSSSAVGLHCPRCGEEVVLDANFCANCRLQLSTTESGMHLRVMPPRSPVPGKAPSAPSTPSSSPLPPVKKPLAEQTTIVPALPLAEQPTIDMKDMIYGASGGNLDQTEPYAVHHLNGQHLGFLVGTRSDPGIKRKYKPNEDSLFAAQGVISMSPLPQVFGLFVVADGMGGHANGEDASRLAIQTIADYMLPLLTKKTPLQSEQYTQLLVEGIQQANLAVHQSNMQQHGDMGTTVTATLLVDTVAHVANVGDSRTYLYRPQEGLRKVTNDHSVVASLVEAGIIKPDDIYTHPKRNQIYRSLGEKAAVEVDSFTVQLQAGDKLLLCSDGLWDMVRDPKIEAVIKNADPNPSITGEALIQSALDGGGEDNVSVIVIHITDGMKAAAMPRFQLLTKPDSVKMPQLYLIVRIFLPVL